jgi:hypothetical protein
MFGRIRTYTPELKMKDDLSYRGYYCGLCEAMSAYGQRSRIMLSHDCTFLYILLSSVYPSKEETEEKRCMIHPIRKRLHITGEHADYCASVNVILGEGQLRDRIADSRSISAGLEYRLLRSAGRKAASRYPEIKAVTDRELERLRILEERRCSDIDEAADTFAVLLGEIFSYGSGNGGRILRELGYQMGRWIYLLDAFEDRDEDRSSGSYNVFNERFGNDEEMLAESARFNILSSLNQAVLSYDLLDIRKNRELLNNIMYLGLNEATGKVLDKENRE